MSDPNRNECSCSEKPNSSNTISRQAAIDAANKLIDRFEQILRDIRETNEDESVCGMCEYDGAFIGQSGDWCNECPGFDKADCFKLSDRCRKKWLKELNLPAAQPEIIRCHQCGFWDRETLRHQFNDFRDWNEAECLILAERDAYDEINRYTEADDYCSRAERRMQYV